jgi:hypothetical protein
VIAARFVEVRRLDLVTLVTDKKVSQDVATEPRRSSFARTLKACESPPPVMLNERTCDVTNPPRRRSMTDQRPTQLTVCLSTSGKAIKTENRTKLRVYSEMIRNLAALIRYLLGEVLKFLAFHGTYRAVHLKNIDFGDINQPKHSQATATML